MDRRYPKDQMNMKYKEAANGIIQVSFSYIESLNISGVKKLHLPAHAIPAVFYLSVHACHLLSLKTVQFSQQVPVHGLLLFFLESQQNRKSSVTTNPQMIGIKVET